MKSILLIGLGRFGRHIAMELNERGHEVMAVDTDEERVNGVLPFVTSAQIGDATKPSVLEALDVESYDLCVVSVGENFQSSLEATSLLKEAGAKWVLSRASTEIQAKFLLRNGADEVVFAEKQMAEKLAVRYSADNIFDYIQLTPEYAIYEIPTPRGWEGKTIREKNIRVKYNLNILAVKHGDKIDPLPAADYVFDPKARLIVMCRKADIERVLR